MFELYVFLLSGRGILALQEESSWLPDAVIAVAGTRSPCKESVMCRAEELLVQTRRIARRGSETSAKSACAVGIRGEVGRWESARATAGSIKQHQYNGSRSGLGKLQRGIGTLPYWHCKMLAPPEHALHCSTWLAKVWSLKLKERRNLCAACLSRLRMPQNHCQSRR